MLAAAIAYNVTKVVIIAGVAYYVSTHYYSNAIIKKLNVKSFNKNILIFTY